LKIAIIGRSESLYLVTKHLIECGFEIVVIVTAKEAPEYNIKSEDFKSLAVAHNISFVHTAKIETAFHFIHDTGANIGISINYPGIIPLKVTDLFKHGILNVHGGDLPMYRGNACQAWALLNSESKIGLCVHKMIGGELDNGDIIARDYISVSKDTKINQVLDWMALRTPELVVNALKKIIDDPDYILEVQSNDPSKALRCYPRRPEDGRICWSKSATDILLLINASNRPYAGAFCQYEKEKIVIWDAEEVEDSERFCAVPGQVTKIGDGFLEVACGTGKLRVLSIEKNDQIMKPNAMIRSIRKRLS